MHKNWQELIKPSKLNTQASELAPVLLDELIAEESGHYRLRDCR